MRKIYAKLFSKVANEQNLPGKRIITYLSFIFLFFFAALGLQAQNNKVLSIAVSATQTGMLTYGTTADATYTVTLTCDEGTPGGTTNLSINWLTTTPSDITVAPSNPIILTAGQKTVTATFTITSGISTAADSYDFTVTSTDDPHTSNSASFIVGEAPLTITANSDTKEYGSVFTTGTGSTAFTSTGLVPGETIGSITTSSNGAPANASVAGSTYPIIPTAATGGTFNASNYTITYVNGLLTVTKPALTITANNGTKVYGNVFITGAGSSAFSSTGLKNSENIGSVTISSTGAPAAASVAGLPYSIIPTAATGGTFNASNYDINYVDGTLSVTKAMLTVTANPQTRIYGLANPALTVTYSGFITGDNASSLTTEPAVSTTAVTNSPVGTYPITVSGGASANYDFTYVAGNLAVTKAMLTVTATASDKIYDGNTTATVSLSSDKLSGDVVNIANTAANFNTRAIGTNKPVTITGISISGTDASNYTLASATASTTANITGRTLTIIATGVNKPYDGNTTATVTLSDDRVTGDAITTAHTSAAFDNKNVGTGKTVSVAGISITGADASNYTFNPTASTTANITKKVFIVSATGVNKTYDGNATATATLSDDREIGDAITTAYTSASFANKNVGTGKSVSVTGITITGTDAANYSLGNTTATTTADITVKVLTVTATGVNKVYNGNTVATVTLANDKIGSDAISMAYVTATFADKNVGTGKTVSVSGIKISGTDAYNYTFNTTTSTTANITAKALTITAIGVNKVYDGTTDATVNLTAIGVVSGDDVTLNYTAASFASATIGTAKTVNVSGITLTGSDADNYSFNTTATTKANITTATTSVDVTLTSGTNPSCFGSSVTFTATITATPAVGNIGTVQFKDVGTSLVTGVSVSGNIATYTTSALIAGSHNITAVYSGTNYSGSTSTVFIQSISPIVKVIAGSDITSCSGMAGIGMTGSSASGTFDPNSVSWTGGTGLGTWSGSGNPSNFIFTPSTPIGSFIATLTVTAASPCIGPITDTRKISWGTSGSWLGVTSTDWSTASNWCGGVPTSTTDVTIPIIGNVLYQPLLAATSSDCRNITINGSLTSNPVNLHVYGNWENNGTFTPGTGRINFDGSSVAQTIGGSSSNTFYKLTINNTNGVTITKNTSVTNELNFSIGRLITGINTLNVNSASVFNAAADKYIYGNLKKIINGNTAKTFEIGDASVYAPVTITFTGSTNNTGSLTANTTAGEHPQIASSFIDPAKSVNRYWTLSNSGVTGFTNYSAVFNFVAGDVTGATANYTVENYNTSTWNLLATGTKTATSTQATGITTFGDFQVGEETTPTACGPGGNTSKGINIIPCIKNQNLPNAEVTVTSSISAKQYFTMDVIGGMTYQVYTAATSSNDPTSRLVLSVFDDVSPNSEVGFSYSNTGNPKGGGSNNVFIQFTAPSSGRVRVLLNQRYDCSATSPTGVKVYERLVGGSNTFDAQNDAGTDSWIGHLYLENAANSLATNYNQPFTTYLGYLTQPETFSTDFGGPNTACSGIISSDGSVKAQLFTSLNFAARFRMNSTRHGLYTVDMGSDDGSRLVVDGTLVYNTWIDHGYYGSYPGPGYAGNLINLNGNSQLQFDFYEKGGDNRLAFTNLKLVIANTLTDNLNQSICSGTPGTLEVTGDVYNSTLPSGISLSGSGYQWAYSTTPGGTLTDIPGATDANFTPTAEAPFNTAGTYYIYRKAILNSNNNISSMTGNNVGITRFDPLTLTNISSNYITLTVNVNPLITPVISGDNEVCIDHSTAPYTSPIPGGIWSVINGTGSAYIDPGTAIVTGITSGDATVTYTISGAGASSDCKITGTKDLTILLSPLVYTVTGGGIYCTSDEGLTVTLSNSQTGVSYQLWRDGTQVGTPAPGSNTMSLVFPIGTATAGTYTIIATNIITGCTNTMSGSAEFIVNPVPVGILIADKASECSEGNITFTATSGFESYQFQDGINNLSGAVGNVLSINTLSVGAHSISVIVTNTNGCSATFDPVSVIVNPLPTGIFEASENSGGSNDNEICAGSTVNLSFDNPQPTYTNYRFILKGTPDTDIYSGTNPFTSISTLNNNDEVFLEVTTNKGCTQMFDTIKFTVNPFPDPAGDITTSSATVCQGQSGVVYTIDALDHTTSYQWTVPTGASIVSGANTNSITVDFSDTAVSGNVTVLGTNDCGSGASKTIAVTVNPLPIAAGNISGNVTVCQGEVSVTYTVTAITNATSYVWNYSGTGATYTDTTSSPFVTINFAANATPGDLTVKGLNDCGPGNISSNYPIAVNLLPADAGTISGKAAICVGTDGVSYSLPNIDQATDYIWSYTGTGATISGTTNPVTIDFSLITTSGTLTVQGSNACGLGVASTKSIIINPLPEGDIKVTETSGIDPDDGIICAGSEIKFIATLTNGTGTNYQFFIGGDSKQNSSSNEFVTSAITANASITVIVTNSNGCTTTLDPYNVIVNALPDVTINGNNTICAGSTDNIYTTETGSEQHDYVWTINGGSIDAGAATNQVSVTWFATGTKSLNVNYTDANGCSSNKSANFIIPPTFTPTITPGSNTPICLNSSVTYTTEADNLDYNWIVAGGTTSGSTTNTITVQWDLAAGPHSVSVNYTDDTTHCSAVSPTVLSVNVNPLPSATISSDITVCQNGPAALTLTGSAGKRVYTFEYDIDGSGATTVSTTSSSDSKIINPVTTTAGDFVYNILKVTDAKGCFSDITEVSSTVHVTPTPSATITYDASPYCKTAGTASVTQTGTTGGVYSATPAGLSINAATGEIDLSASTPRTYTVKYYIAQAGECATFTTTTTVVVTALPTVSISYGSNPFCTTSGLVNVTRTGSGAYTGGTYSVFPITGLTINTSTGQVTPSSSTGGTYTVTYSSQTSGGCAVVTATADITITTLPTATITYTGDPYCSSITSAPFILNGTGAYTGGTYTFTPAGLSINASTGAIDPSASTPGTYYIKYHITPSGGCAAVVTLPVSITITAKPFADAGGPMSTCASSGTIAITSGTASNYGTVTWTTNGDGTIINSNSLTTATYTPGPNDLANKGVTLTLTATGNGNCADAVSIKFLTITDNPIAVVINPQTANYCIGSIVPLTSVKAGVNSGSPIFYSTVNNVAIPDNNFNGINNTAKVTGIPANAIINSISVNFNITHPSDHDLTINLKAPNPQSPFAGELNLVTSIPTSGTGANFINTVINSTSVQPIQNFGTAPYTGVYAPQANFGALGTAFATSFNQLYTTGASVNGNWVMRVADNGLTQTGTLNNWSITIAWSVPVDPIGVIWTPATDLYTDAGATIPYVPGSSESTVYAKPATAGTLIYTATAGSGCTTTTSVTLVGRPSPAVTILANYCSDDLKHRVELTANSTDPAVSYNWSDGSTAQTTFVDEANNYSVSVTNSDGCVGTNNIDISQELVVNGDFTQGNIGFISGYTYHADVAGNSELVPDGGTDGYGVGVNGQNYHGNFWGQDHTNNQMGNRNFMLVNGHDNITVWEQTVNVLPNTRYYYSAWAMNLNNVGISARLQFQVNGKNIGTVAELNSAPKPSSNADVNLNNWIRFYYGNEDGWYSDTNTTAIIRIVDLESAPNGNDFGLDDISFATLSPFVTGPMVPLTDSQTVCSEVPISTITYKVGSGASGPVVFGLPPDLQDSVTFDGLNLVISGSSIYPGTYNYIVATGGDCPNPKADTGVIVINASALLTLNSDITSKVQNSCIGTNVTPVIYSLAGGGTSANVSGDLPPGVSWNYNSGTKKLNISGVVDPSASGTYKFFVNTVGSCLQKMDSGTITIYPAAIGGAINQPTVCLGDAVTLSLSGNSGNISRWELSTDGGGTWSPIANTAGLTSIPYTITGSASFRAVIQFSTCTETTSTGGRIRVNNLWEGKNSSVWSTASNWSSGSTPNITYCSNTVTIPKGVSYDPVLTTQEKVNNINILPNGRLTISATGKLQVAGVITSNGDLDATDGSIEFNGSSSQNISSSLFKDTTINNLIVSNLSGLCVSTSGSSLAVTGKISFGTATGKLFSGDNITLKSTRLKTASLGVVGDNNNVNGKFTVERYINVGGSSGQHGKKWIFLATPTTGQSIYESWMEGKKTPVESGFGAYLSGVGGTANDWDRSSPNPSVKEYDPTQSLGFKGAASANVPLLNPKGWFVFVRGDRTVDGQTVTTATPTVLRSKGKLTVGYTPISIPQVQGFYSIGNPYASAVDVKKLFGIDGNYYVWNPNLGGEYGYGAYQTFTYDPDTHDYVPASGNSDTVGNYILSGQAFFVQSALGDEYKVEFNESYKGDTTANKEFFRRGPVRTSKLRSNIYAADETLEDGTLQIFDDKYSNAVDRFDARKMLNTGINLSVKVDNKLLVVERKETINSVDTIFFNLTGTANGKYKFQFVSDNLSEHGLEAWLEDGFSGNRTPVQLEGTTDVSFDVTSAAASKAANRFRIVFKPQEAPLPVTFINVKAVKDGGDISVQWKVANEYNVNKYIVMKSTDGTNFSDIASVKANGGKDYSSFDKNVADGYNYYRIRSEDKNGELSYSSIVKVWAGNIVQSITVFPNPVVKGIINLKLENQPAGKYSVRLLNPIGQVILTRRFDHAGGNYSEKIPWDYKIAHGAYQMEVTKPDGGVKVIMIMY